MKGQITTLEQIRARKKELKTQINKKKTALKGQSHSLLAPVPVRNKFDLGYHWLSNGLAIYDGVRMGMQVMKYIRRLL